MKCEYCGKEFERKSSRGRVPKYCSRECCQSADRDNKRITYVGKREEVCRQCGKKLPKFKTRFCSNYCREIQEGRHHGLLQKVCVVCGSKFETQKSRQKTCSTECSKYNENHRPYDSEKERLRYLKEHPDARSMDEIKAASQVRLAKLTIEREQRAQEREKERAAIRAKKEEIKQANIAYWHEYNEVHECEDCGEKYIAHFPLAKYCPACKKRKERARSKHRYDGIAIDKDITLGKLAKRDNNICWICGLFVDWTDKRPGNNTTVVGDMYPSIDHIIPISKGGMHSWDNVALAHMKCNSWKRDMIIKKVAK